MLFSQTKNKLSFTTHHIHVGQTQTKRKMLLLEHIISSEMPQQVLSCLMTQPMMLLEAAIVNIYTWRMLSPKEKTQSTPSGAMMGQPVTSHNIKQHTWMSTKWLIALTNNTALSSNTQCLPLLTLTRKVTLPCQISSSTVH